MPHFHPSPHGSPWVPMGPHGSPWPSAPNKNTRQVSLTCRACAIAKACSMLGRICIDYTMAAQWGIVYYVFRFNSRFWEETNMLHVYTCVLSILHIAARKWNVWSCFEKCFIVFPHCSNTTWKEQTAWYETAMELNFPRSPVAHGLHVRLTPSMDGWISTRVN